MLNKILRWFVPEDEEVGCGYGPFKFKKDHPFNQVCALHDQEFGDGHDGKQGLTKDDVDWDLFWQWAQVASAESDPKIRMKLVWDICKYWPVARVGGNLMWEGRK